MSLTDRELMLCPLLVVLFWEIPETLELGPRATSGGYFVLGTCLYSFSASHLPGPMLTFSITPSPLSWMDISAHMHKIISSFKLLSQVLCQQHRKVGQSQN